MSRVAHSQADLFAPPQADMFATPADDRPAPDPLNELRSLLDVLRAAKHLPWADAAATMAQEHRALGLARQVGPEGEALASAVMEETERLLSALD